MVAKGWGSFNLTAVARMLEDDGYMVQVCTNASQSQLNGVHTTTMSLAQSHVHQNISDVRLLLLLLLFLLLLLPFYRLHLALALRPPAQALNTSDTSPLDSSSNQSSDTVPSASAAVSSSAASATEL